LFLFVHEFVFKKAHGLIKFASSRHHVTLS
jgi:hypothetical protein